MKKPAGAKRLSGGPPKPPKNERPADTAQNKALTQQNRKLLGKHYAARYGKKRGG